jgi:hypothetical protein
MMKKKKDNKLEKKNKKSIKTRKKMLKYQTRMKTVFNYKASQLKSSSLKEIFVEKIS